MTGEPRSRAVVTRDRDLVRIATFILLDASVFHDALAGVDARVSPLIKATPPLQRHLDRAWADILKIDYAPVFDIAREVLLSFPNSPITEEMLRKIIDIASSVGASGVLTRHDFMGRIYHKLLLRTTGQYYATYYTSIPAAWLLANLVMKTPHPRWNFASIEEIEEFRVIDPACGSGTLLSAAYMAIKDLYLLSLKGGTNPDLDALHRVLVEKVIHGWDVLDYASHLTLTTLALHSNRSLVQSSNVYTLPVGVEKGTVHLGSLDQLKRQTLLVGHGFGGLVKSQALGGTREQQEVVAPESDVVIMNPPFSRSAKPNVKFGFSPPKEKKSLDQELARLTRELGMVGIGNAGLSAPFMVLALELCTADGRIGVVLPRSMLSGVAWTAVREEILKQTEVEYIASNFDPGGSASGQEGWNWSENTALGEVLIVARKTTSPPKSRRVTYVNLWRRPRNEIESLLISHQIMGARASECRLRAGSWRSLTMGADTFGAAYDVSQPDLHANWLTPCVFASPELNALTLELFLGDLARVPLREIADTLGRDIHPVKNHFAESTTPTSYPMLWGHRGAMSRMSLPKGELTYGQPLKGKQSDDMFTGFAAQALLAERPHPSTECLFATRTTTRVLATAFWEIRFKDPAHELLFVLWFNSTYGILEYLARATSSMGDIFKAKKDQIAEMRLPDPATIDLKACKKTFEDLKTTPLTTVAAEFGLASSGQGIRHAIDQFLYRALDLPELRTEHYSLLARDPVLTKKPLEV